MTKGTIMTFEESLAVLEQWLFFILELVEEEPDLFNEQDIDVLEKTFNSVHSTQHHNFGYRGADIVEDIKHD
jgi:hypothetical protein